MHSPIDNNVSTETVMEQPAPRLLHAARGSVAGVVKYWWQKPKMEDGDDMISDSLKQEGKEIGITLNAAGSGILLQLGEVPTCHKCELHQIRVTLNRDEAAILKHKLERLMACLPEPLNEKVSA